jgi:hypothetical protein
MKPRRRTMLRGEVTRMNDPVEFSDADFMQWAGVDPQRWGLLPREKRESWLNYLIERLRATPQSEERDEWWKLAYVIARAPEQL